MNQVLKPAVHVRYSLILVEYSEELLTLSFKADSLIPVDPSTPNEVILCSYELVPKN